MMYDEFVISVEFNGKRFACSRKIMKSLQLQSNMKYTDVLARELTNGLKKLQKDTLNHIDPTYNLRLTLHKLDLR